MAGASMNDIRARMKSVQSTMQITKAMELGATSKLRRQKERAERERPYGEALLEAIRELSSSSDVRGSVFCESGDGGSVLKIVIAGDRGLAGGYNQSAFKLAEYGDSEESVIFCPIGKKALERYRARGYEIYTDSLPIAGEVGVGDLLALGEIIVRDFAEGKLSRVELVYTKFKSMISQVPEAVTLLPLPKSEEPREKTYRGEPLIEEEPDELLSRILPEYIGGLIHSALSESLASESGARRTAMNAANKNAEEMIDSLMLRYNRARQSIITQEITEIVSGAEAL